VRVREVTVDLRWVMGKILQTRLMRDTHKDLIEPISD
jgi:hypothetical protein